MSWVFGLLLVAFSCVCVAGGAAAQAHGTRPRLALDCGRDCLDGDYYRQALSYFDWVRDQHEADIAIRVVKQLASNGGWSYTLTLRRPRQPASAAIVRTVSAAPGDSPAADRERLFRAAMLSLLEALRGSPHEDAFQVSLPERTDTDLAAVSDGWDHWVIAPELGAIVEAESNFYFMELEASLSVRRITELTKFRSTTTFTRRSVSYVLEDDERVSGHVNGLTQRLMYAWSVGRHWAFGALGVGGTGIYENYELHLHGGPIVEWNAFPYEENASRQLRFAYQAGAWYSRYFERSVLGRRQETRPYHALSLIVDLNQAWGSVQAVLQANEFIDDPARWRLAAGLTFTLALVAGLALQFEGEVAWIHDQINLRRRGLTDREVFLETRELEKTVSLTAEFGFSYTFGSVHNAIVNPRFGRVDLEED